MNERTRGSRIASRAARARVELTAALLDSVLIAGGYCLAMLVRTVGDASQAQWSRLLHFLPVAVVVTLACAWGWGLYAQLWRHASIAEARRVLGAGVTAAVGVTVASVPVGRPFPLSVSLFGSLAVTTLLGGVRFQSRLFALRRREVEPNGLRVVILGAGEAAAELVRNMRRDPRQGLTPVVMLDDDPRKQNRSSGGVLVAGSFDDLPAIAREHDLHQVILAVPSATRSVVRRAADLADRADLPLKVLPAVQDLIGGRVRTTSVRDLRIDDLLGRSPVVTDLGAVRALLTGRRVLVTGAGGSIGAEIARQVAACVPESLMLLDHDETHLHDTMQSINEDAAPILADIREGDLIRQLCVQHRPQVIFHAAAHKHVPLLEAHPSEAVKTNILGTRNLLNAARACSTERFVFISTDKAVDPSCVMGATKRIGELATLAAGAESSSRAFCAVRFGNVLGSRGSVIPTFLRQIETGGPVTVTHPRMTRFFMSIPEAVQLVLQAAALSDGGEIFMLEMGEPIRIADLAERMVRLSGHQPGADIEIRYTGVRPGEKLEEELRIPSESPEPTRHPSIVALHAQRRPAPLNDDQVTAVIDSAISGRETATYAEAFALAGSPGSTRRAHPAQAVLDIREKASWTSSTT